MREDSRLIIEIVFFGLDNSDSTVIFVVFNGTLLIMRNTHIILGQNSLVGSLSL